MGFIFNFTNESEYYSPQYVLSSQSPFNPPTGATRHRIDTPNAIWHTHHAFIRLWDLFLILQVGSTITALSMFCVQILTGRDNDNLALINLIISTWPWDEINRAAIGVFSSVYFSSSLLNIHSLCSYFDRKRLNDNQVGINLIISAWTESKWIGLQLPYFYL